MKNIFVNQDSGGYYMDIKFAYEISQLFSVRVYEVDKETSIKIALVRLQEIKKAIIETENQLLTLQKDQTK